MDRTRLDPSQRQELVPGPLRLAGAIPHFAQDGVDQAEPFFDRPELQDDALEQLAIEGAKAAIADLLQRLENNPWDGSDVDQAKAWLGDAAKAAGVKKGVVMKSLRAALLGRLQGPDLITTWSLLARIGEDLPRLRRCLG